YFSECFQVFDNLLADVWSLNLDDYRSAIAHPGPVNLGQRSRCDRAARENSTEKPGPTKQLRSALDRNQRTLVRFEYLTRPRQSSPPLRRGTGRFDPAGVREHQHTAVAINPRGSKEAAPV